MLNYLCRVSSYKTKNKPQKNQPKSLQKQQLTLGKLCITFLEWNSSSSASPCSGNFPPSSPKKTITSLFPVLTSWHWLPSAGSSRCHQHLLFQHKYFVWAGKSLCGLWLRSPLERLFYRIELKHLTLLYNGIIIVLLSEFQRSSVE